MRASGAVSVLRDRAARWDRCTRRAQEVSIVEHFFRWWRAWRLGLPSSEGSRLIDGQSGTAKSLAYAPSKGILYVLHSFGPDHLRLMCVDGQRKLTARPQRYTANTKDKTDRVPSMAVLSPDGNCPLWAPRSTWH
jgi:hypothetical protein